MGKPLTEEHKAKMKAGREAAMAAKLKESEVAPETEVQEVKEEKPESPQLPVAPQVDPNLVATIVHTVLELQKQNPQIATATPDQKLDEIVKMSPTKPSQATLGKNGVQGITYKYSVDKGYYPDPTERLLDEPKLARFAMRDNYRFRWSVDGETYEKHGMTFAEPRFTLELFRLLYDEEGTPTGRMALVARAMQHEDEMTTRMAAQKLGLLDKFENTEEGFRLLMDEIRYWRIQQWLFGIFTPPKITTFRRQATTEVIAGKVVEVYDTEELTDHDTGVAAASTLASQSGVGGVETPKG